MRRSVETVIGWSMLVAAFAFSPLASAQDFESEGLRRLLVNAAYWLVGLGDKIPEKSKVDLVGDYKASPFRGSLLRESANWWMCAASTMLPPAMVVSR